MSTLPGIGGAPGAVLHTRERAIELLASHGFTEQFDEGENGDFGPRLYFCKPGAERNQHGRPLEYAQIDCWGASGWTATRPGKEQRRYSTLVPGQEPG